MTGIAASTTAQCEAILCEIERAVVGKRSALTRILTAVLAGGHVLIEVSLVIVLRNAPIPK